MRRLRDDARNCIGKLQGDLTLNKAIIEGTCVKKVQSPIRISTEQERKIILRTFFSSTNGLFHTLHRFVNF